MNHKKGFTVIELVITVVVLVILAAILIPTFSSVVDEAKEHVPIEQAKEEWELYYQDNLDSMNNNDVYVIISTYDEKTYIYEARGEDFITSSLDIALYKNSLDLTLDEYGNEKFGYNKDVKICNKNQTSVILIPEEIALKNAKTEWGLFLSEYVDDFKYNDMYIVICTYDNVEYVYETKGASFNTESIDIDTSIYDNALDLTLDKDGNEKFGYNKDVKIYAKIKS